MSVEIGLNEVERLCAQRSPAFISTGKDLTPATENLRFRETKTLPKLSSSIRRFFRDGVSTWYGTCGLQHSSEQMRF